MNMHNAVSDALVEIRANPRIQQHIEFIPNDNIYRVELVRGVSRLCIEMISDDHQGYVGYVMEKRGFSDRFQERFMDALMNKLELN
jgi:hypothetical protein